MKHSVRFKSKRSEQWKTILSFFFHSGGGFEGDMIFPDGFDPTTADDARGVAISGSRQWPGNVIPYDLSGIYCKSIV
jgi:hypothetical protein